MILHVWDEEKLPAGPADWELGRVKILPKKGDLSDTNNWRGICLLEVSYKILGNILLARLNDIGEHIDHRAGTGSYFITRF